MIEKNTVILGLKDYLDLIKENVRLEDEVERLSKDRYNLSAERAKLRKLILEEAEYNTIWRVTDEHEFEFELERVIDVEDWAFGLRDSKKLLRLGFTLEELTDYIIEVRKGYENERRKR